MPIESPWDHNAECRYCDEQAHHRADCSWLMALEQQVASQEEVITNQLRNLGDLRRQLDEATAAAKDMAAKIQFLVDWAEGQGMLGEHVFTFPDGDTWEAKR